MDDLNKNQIILLALLVSFVGSVATSIMTYSLLNEAPPTITRTINRVVERTVETIVPQPSNPKVVTKEVTVIVKEEDLVIDAIAKNKSSLVRIWRLPLSDEETKTFVGIGLILNKEGLIVTRKGDDFPLEVQFEAILPAGEIVSLVLSGNSSNFFSFRIEDLETLNLTEASLGDSQALQLGQSVISINGIEKDRVSTGRITGIEESAEEENSRINLFESDIIGTLPGSPAINLQGEIIGISIDEQGNFLPIDLLKEDLETLT